MKAGEEAVVAEVAEAEEEEDSQLPQDPDYSRRTDELQTLTNS
jgi:hypothetical protein